MSIHHLKIRKTDQGHFALVQLDKTDKRVTQKHCSGDLEEVIDSLLDRREAAGTPENRARDYGPVLEIIKNLARNYPSLNAEDFPADWTDSLDLYGCLSQELTRFRIDLDSERRKLAVLIFDSGPEWVWKNRLRLVAERVSSFSPHHDPERPPESLKLCK